MQRASSSIRPNVTRTAALLFAAVASDGLWGQTCEVTETQRLITSDAGELDAVGLSVAIDTDVMVVGTSQDDDLGREAGAAYVFRFDGSLWVEEHKLLASDGESGDNFGHAVAVSDDVILVGAWLDDGAAQDMGAAYVFRYDGTTWEEEQKLTASDGWMSDFLGASVALDGDLALALSPIEGGYAFRFDGTEWVEEQKILSVIQTTVVAMHAGVAVFGDSLDDLLGMDAGVAHVLRFDGTTWLSEQELRASDAGAGLAFGWAVSVNDDQIVVGAYGDAHAGGESGSAYVFRFDGSTWNEEQKLVASDARADAFFGASVSIQGDRVVVGAMGIDVGEDPVVGSGYLYRFDGSSWVEKGKLTADGGTPEEYFGFALSMDGDHIAIGMPGASEAAEISGAVCVFPPTVARATFRNAGSNSVSYAATAPLLGGTFFGSVDLLGTTGHQFAALLGYASPLSVTLGGGQVLLVNVADGAGELLGLGTAIGPVAFFAAPVPSDPALYCFRLSTQAVHVGGVQPFALSNAQDLVVGD